MKYTVITSLLLAIATPAFALPTCTPSNRVPTENYPGEKLINPSNNLVLPAGKAMAAEGQKITIIGTVIDKNCVPVSNAVVELWQHNPYGRWVLGTGEDLAGAAPTFTGAGRAITNSEGKFTFYTAFPAPSGKRAPFVNIKIAPSELSDFTTALFFAGDERNATDKVYAKLSEKTLKDVSLKVMPNEAGQLTGTIDIVLPVAMPYRVY